MAEGASLEIDSTRIDPERMNPPSPQGLIELNPFA
jgi:hypothetical protein